MGSDIGEQYYKCPCLKSCKECNDFKKCIHLKDTGLVIYQHNSFDNSNKECDMVNSTQSTSDDIIILHNIRDVEITSVDFASELEKYNLRCPRCRNIIERTKILLQKIKTIDKKAVIGVCNHCLREENFQSSCYECEGIVKKFESEFEGKEESKRKKLWVSKIKNVLQDARNDDEKFIKLKSRIRSDTYVTKSIQVAKTERSTLSDMSKLKTTGASAQCIIKADTIKSSILVKSKERLQQKSNIFDAEEVLISDKKPLYVYDKSNLLNNQNIDNTQTVVENIPIERYKELRENFESKSLSDLRKMKTDIHSLFDPVYKAQNIKHESMKKTSIPVISFEQFKKYKEPKNNLEFSNSQYQKGTVSSEDKIYFREAPSVQESEMLNSRDTFKDMSEFYSDQKTRLEFFESNNGPSSSLGKDRKAVPKAKQYSRLLLQNRSYHSKEPSIISRSDVTKEALDKGFSYCFPKDKTFKKSPNSPKSSAELILDTQYMLKARADEQKRKNEEKYHQRLQEQKLKKIARQEKRNLLEEEKIRLEEEKTKEEEQRKEEEANQKPEVKEQKNEEELRNEEKVKSKNPDKIKRDKTTKLEEDKSKIFTNKTKSKDTDDSKKRNLDPKHSKDKDAITTDKEKNAEKEKEKKDRERQLRLQKEEKQREKKEKLKANKEAEHQKKIEENYKQNGSVKKEKKEELHKDKELKEDKKGEQTKKIEPIEPMKKDYSQSQNKSIKQEKAKSDNEVDIIKKQSKGNDSEGTEQLQKALLELAKEKEEALKLKKQQEENERKARETAAKKEADELKLASKKEAIPTIKPEPEKKKPIPQQKTETPTTKELNVNQIKVRRPSPDDLILQLVQLKQSGPKGERHKTTRLSELNVTPLSIKEHREHKNTKLSTCLMCIDSDLELDVESIVLKKDQTEELADIVIGQKIFKYKPLNGKEQKRLFVPILFQTSLNEDISLTRETKILDFFNDDTEKTSLAVLPPKHGKISEQEPPKGVIRYALSDRTFIDKGWTMLPTEKVVRKMNVYRMRPAHPEFDWFEHNKNKRLMLYNTGEKLAEFDDNGLGRWFYKNGGIALDYYNAEEINAQQRIVIYSSGEPDERGRTHPLTILATFDYLGNGIVFDHSGKIRLKYNQTEGVLLDRSIGPVSHWKWHTLNDPPVLQKVMIDTQVAHKDPDIFKMGGQGDNINRPDNEEMLAIEFDNFIKEKSKKLSQSFKPFQIKMKALKINEQFSLKILDQATVYLIFRDGAINLKLNIGMILDHKEIVDTDTAEVGEVSNNLERFPARTDSLAGLQRSVAYAQRFEKLRTDRERRLYPTEPCVSADRLTAAASRPLRPPFRTVSSGSTSDTNNCKCIRKLSSTNLYYNTRLI